MDNNGGVFARFDDFIQVADGAVPDHIRRQAELLADEGYEGFFSVELIGPDNPQAVMANHAEGWKKLQAML